MTQERAVVVGIGLYTIPEAAALLGRHFNTVRSWVQQGLAPAPVHYAFGETTILSFHDLISLMIVKRLRDEGVKLDKVRKAEQYLRSEWGFTRPFATERILTEGQSVFVALTESGVTSVDRWGQETLSTMLVDLLHDVTYDAMTELASAWQPRSGVLLKPDVQFGQPCIAGTRITTSSVAELVEAGDPVDFVAESFAIQPAAVRAAIDFERDLLHAA